MGSLNMSPRWLGWIPACLRRKISHRPSLLMSLDNLGWLLADKVLRLGVGLVVGVWFARYLGPEQFGLFNYALALVALFGAIASVGLKGIVVRDLVRQPESAAATLGSGFVLQLFGGLVAFMSAVLAVLLLRPDDPLSGYLVAVLGAALVFKASDVVRYAFEAQVASRHVVRVDAAVFLLLAAVKIGLILAEAPLVAFAWAAFAEAGLVAAGLFLLAVRRGPSPGQWRARAARMKTLLADSWPLVLSGLAVMVYMRIDQIMLGQMVGDDAVGIYSAALRLSEAWFFVPTAIAATTFPAILAVRSTDAVQYRQRLEQLFRWVVALGVAVAVVVTLLADSLISALYGPSYAAAGILLAVHVWTGVFVGLGVVSGNWYLAENLQTLALQRTLLGGVVNVLANLALIPLYGALGAALATLIAQMAAAYLFDAFHPATRTLFRSKTRAVLTFYRPTF